MTQLNEIPRLCDWMTQRGETNILEEAACVEFVHSRASRVRINQAKLRLGFVKLVGMAVTVVSNWVEY